MPIRQTTSNADLDRFIEKRVKSTVDAIIYRLSVVGERVINQARDTDKRTFKDQTGNLRSSIGYVIVSDGQIVKASDFRTVKGGSQGSATGRSYAERLAQQFPDGIVLIVVAGMNYATYVSAKGLDVLDSAELLAQREIPKMLERLGLK